MITDCNLITHVIFRKIYTISLSFIEFVNIVKSTYAAYYITVKFMIIRQNMQVQCSLTLIYYEISYKINVQL